MLMAYGEATVLVGGWGWNHKITLDVHEGMLNYCSNLRGR